MGEYAPEPSHVTMAHEALKNSDLDIPPRLFGHLKDLIARECQKTGLEVWARANDRLDALEAHCRAHEAEDEKSRKLISHLQKELAASYDRTRDATIAHVKEREGLKEANAKLEAENAKLHDGIWSIAEEKARVQLLNDKLLNERIPELEERLEQAEARVKQLGDALGTAQEAAMADAARCEQDAKRTAALERLLVEVMKLGDGDDLRRRGLRPNAPDWEFLDSVEERLNNP